MSGAGFNLVGAGIWLAASTASTAYFYRMGMRQRDSLGQFPGYLTSNIVFSLFSFVCSFVTFAVCWHALSRNFDK